MTAALELLLRPAGPVLEDFPEAIADASSEPLACPLPPRHDADLAAAIDEAQGLRAAYDRNLAKSGRTLVGRAVGADDVPKAIDAFRLVAAGHDPKEAGAEAGIGGHPLQWSRDVTSYYEEAAAALVDHVPAARSAETWFHHQTETGKLLLAARAKLREAGEPYWFYLVPFTQDL